MSTAAERIAEARARDEEGIDQEAEEEEATPFEAPESAPEPGEPEAEPEAEPEQAEQRVGLVGMTAEQTAELEKAWIAYQKRVAKSLGGELPPECSHCNGLGFDLTGGAGTPDYCYASDKATCDECMGLGGVLSGSKVPGQDVVRCERCKGRGYLVTGPVKIVNPEQVAPVVVELAEGNADGGQAAALKPGDPGWEPWMGGGDAQVGS